MGLGSYETLSHPDSSLCESPCVPSRARKTKPARDPSRFHSCACCLEESRNQEGFAHCGSGLPPPP